MRELGINRVSFGVQSFDAHKLKALNRAHTPQEAIDAIHIAKDIGIEHISLDLIYNYQGDTLELMNRDIEMAFSLPIDHISAYELTIESGTHFSSRPEVRQEYEELAFFVAKAISSRGFDHYEISNFGSYRSRHNIGYWRLDDYMGVGAGAVGFLKDRRYYPQRDIDSYISNPLDIDEEIVASDDMLTEKIFLGLRSYIGIQMSLLSDEMRRRADYLVQKSKLTLYGTRYQNPNLFLADEIALYLLSD
jgi:oxygen-independent coproporphyrinogen-3 oxidase